MNSRKREKVLITGINGFIASHLAEFLEKAGFEVWGLGKGKCRASCSRYFEADILDRSAVAEAAAETDAVIHLAAVTTHSSIMSEPRYALQVSLAGTVNALAAFTSSKGRLFIYPSTGKVYGQPRYLPYDEGHPLVPQTFLGKMKKNAEDLVGLFADSSDKSFVILRIFNIYGSGQTEHFLIPTIISQLKTTDVSSPQTIVLGDIKAKRDYLFIDDLVEAMALLLRTKLEKVQIFNLGSGLAFSAEDIVEQIGEILQRKIDIRVDENRYREGESREEIADISKLTALGFTPQISLIEGLCRTLESFGLALK